MKVEILYVDGCPGYERVLPLLRRLCDTVGAELAARRIDTAEQAVTERFLGSPTVRVDGRDVEPEAARRTDFAVKCRLYPTAAGLVGAPPEAWLRAAVANHDR